MYESGQGDPQDKLPQAQELSNTFYRRVSRREGGSSRSTIEPVAAASSAARCRAIVIDAERRTVEAVTVDAHGCRAWIFLIPPQ